MEKFSPRTRQRVMLSNLQLIAAAILLAIGNLLIDLWLPLGVAAGVPYVALVLLGWWFPKKQHVILLASVGTILTLVGYWFSSEGGIAWMVATNRFLALFAIWVIAVLMIVIKKSETDLLTAKEEAERSNQAKSKFLSSMSHELRTPLNAILGFTQLLKLDQKDPLTPKQIEATEHILLSGDHLLNLIKEVLDLAQIESGNAQVNIELQDPTAIVENCASIASTLVEQRGLTFYDRTIGWKLPEISIDGTRFQQILLNLLSNAVKYNRDKGTVTLSLEEVGEDVLRISVADSGLGIAEEKHEQLFTPFSRLGLENSDITGTGIGLTITKELVEAMGGTIGFQSTLNLGSTFWVDLPIVSGTLSVKTLDDLPTTTTTTTNNNNNNTSLEVKHTVLCVEDNPSSLKLLESIIERIQGTTMISAHTGELGINLAEIHRPNVITMDLNLPGIDGIEVLRRLKASSLTKDIPVIALTARASDRDKNEGLEAGFVEYLTKPINVEEISSALNQLFQKS